MRIFAFGLLHGLMVACGLWTVFGPTLENGFTRIQTDHGDTVLNHYLLEHSYRVVTDSSYPYSLWSPPFFYPEPTVFAYSENMLGVAPIYWLVRLRCSPELTFQIWMLIIAALNYLSMAWVLSRLSLRDSSHRLPWPLVMLGAFVWAFGLPVQSQLRHIQLLATFWMPPAMYWGWHFAQNPAMRPLLRVLICVGLQCLTCVNTGWFLLFGVVVYLPISIATNRTGREFRDFVGQSWWKAAVAVGIWGLVLGAFFSPYIFTNHAQPRAYGECIEYMPTLDSFLGGPEGSRWYETLHPLIGDVNPEARFFAGFGLIFLLVTAIASVASSATRHHDPQASRFVVAGLLTALVLVLLTAHYVWGLSPWWLIRLLPGGFAIRAVGRVSIPFYLFLIPAVMVGFWQWVASRYRSPRPRLLVTLLALAIVVFEQTGYDSESFDHAEYWQEVDRIGEQLRGADAGCVIVPSGRKPTRDDLIAMWAGMRANVPVVNGYSGRGPYYYPGTQDITDDDIKIWMADRFRGRLVIIDQRSLPWQVRRYTLP